MRTGPGFPIERPRRLRGSAALRRMVAETRLHPADLVLPMFVKEDITAPVPVPSMPGVVQHTLDSLLKAGHEAVEAGVGGLILFGVPSTKDGRGSAADDPEGVVQVALRHLRSEFGDSTVLMADLCLDEYTDHGHCGILVPESGTGPAGTGGPGGSGPGWAVDNDATLERYADIALAQAAAGAHLVAPSGMMDGQVGAIRSALDSGGFGRVGILAYSAKYASAFYGPFRDAAECAPRFGDRSGYQQDPPNLAEALREVRLDLDEGADAVMVKPALAYLDVIRRVRDEVDVPVAAYQVSGEYAMVEAAAARGWIDRERVITETLTSIRRAGADIVLSYWATEAARRLH
ncbi:MAG TPA: porphobilinogen synthase [Mycobacteriales bacterium]|nr:porphobilinogen synthase [Mycobacteriales bacterium]